MKYEGQSASPIRVIVHPGSLKPRSEYRNDEDIYGSYEEYLRRLQDSIIDDEQYPIVICPPSHKKTFSEIINRNSLSFDLPKKTEVIKDHYSFFSPHHYSGDGAVLSSLKRLGTTNIDLCGEQVWWFMGEYLIPGCVMHYYDFLRMDFPVKIRKELCYPTKDLPEERCVTPFSKKFIKQLAEITK